MRWAIAALATLALMGCESHNRGGGDGSSAGDSTDQTPAKNDGFFFEICQRPSNPPDIQKTIDALKEIAGKADCGEANAYFDTVSSLNLADKGLSNLLPIKGLKVLTQLILDNNEITSLDPVNDLRNLTLLSAANNKIKSVAPLAMLDKLANLTLDGNLVDSIFALRALPAVKSFSMANNPLGGGPIKKSATNCDPSSKSPAIASWCSPTTAFLRICNEGSSADKDERHTVDVIKAKLKATSCDEANLKLTKLTKLALPLKRLVSVAPLRGLKELKQLDLSYNFIEDIGPLSNLVNLTSFSVYSNKITSIEAVQYFTKVDTLNISFNYITDFMPLRNLKQLRYNAEKKDYVAFRAEYNPLGCREFLDSEYCQGERTPIEATKFNCPFDAKGQVVADWCQYGPNFASRKAHGL